MLVEGTNFLPVGRIEKITMADSFVSRNNKTESGNGEAKLYIGQDSDASIWRFFGNPGFSVKCFFLRDDLHDFFLKSKPEYDFPSMDYRGKNQFSSLYLDRGRQIASQPTICWFQLSHQNQIAPPRVYVKSAADVFSLMRELAFPKISYLSIMKLAKGTDVIYYFKLFIDYTSDFPEGNNPVVLEKENKKINQDTTIAETEKKQLIIARIGQGKFRAKLLEELKFCPITMVSDARFLRASHIKPWVVSDNFERLDVKNGFLFTPTIDLLFDQGFITFDKSKRILASNWVDQDNLRKIGITPNSVVHHLDPTGREEYLDYHREKIFKC